MDNTHKVSGQVATHDYLSSDIFFSLFSLTNHTLRLCAKRIIEQVALKWQLLHT